MSSKIAYGVTVNGEEVYVQADNRAQAVRAATKPLVSGIRSLTGGEVMSLAAEGKKFIIAGQEAEADEEPPADEQQQ